MEEVDEEPSESPKTKKIEKKMTIRKKPEIAHKPKETKETPRRRSNDSKAKARRTSFASGAEGDNELYAIVNGRCQKCNAKIDVSSMEKYGPDKKIL